jgi:hypothetical protein
MSSQTAFDAFAGRLAAWTDTPVVFENDPDQNTPDTPAPFVYAEIYGDSYNQETMGAPQANVWLERGVTYLHVMVPTGWGSRQARVYANDLLYLFREQSIAGMVMTEMSIGAGKPEQSFGNYFSIAATIFWERHDITSIPTP